MDQNQERRRGHFHRGRRGSDRRGLDRRGQPPPQGRDHVDVEHIMRDIRARIAQRQGIELTNQQIQDLAARKLESILDPRAIKPSLLEGLRRTAGGVTPSEAPKASSEPVYAFEDTTIYDSHRVILRLVRRLLNPLLKLFFNPNPLIRALHLQARLNVEAAAREAERDQRQAEWNALHYEIVQRLVTEVSRVSLELQSLSLRVESLNARVDFNDRRVRSLEGMAHAGRPAARPVEAAAGTGVTDAGTAPAEGGADTPLAEGARRRRRRRRGRRGNVLQTEAGQATTASLSGSAQMEPESAEVQPEPVALNVDVAPASAESETLAEQPSPPAPAEEPPTYPARTSEDDADTYRSDE